MSSSWRSSSPSLRAASAPSTSFLVPMARASMFHTARRLQFYVDDEETQGRTIPKYLTALRRDRPRRAFRWGKLADLFLARRLAFPRRFFLARIREKPSRSRPDLAWFSPRSPLQSRYDRSLVASFDKNRRGSGGSRDGLCRR